MCFCSVKCFNNLDLLGGLIESILFDIWMHIATNHRCHLIYLNQRIYLNESMKVAKH